MHKFLTCYKIIREKKTASDKTECSSTIAGSPQNGAFCGMLLIVYLINTLRKTASGPSQAFLKITSENFGKSDDSLRGKFHFATVL